MRHAAAWQLAQRTLREGRAAALVTVAAVKGSAPREAGACMCVTAHQSAGTIGGGTLEYKAIASAREMLLGDSAWRHQQLGLGPALGQCCGGRVELLLERLDNTDLRWLDEIQNSTPQSQLHSYYHTNGRQKQLQPKHIDSTVFNTDDKQQYELIQATHPGHFHLLLFGAGHLGKALAPLLGTLPCTVHWIDSRGDAMPDSNASNIRCEWLETPTLALQDAPTHSYALVMTHNHALDFEITAAALAHPNIAWVGLIGSQSKRRQLERHLLKQHTPPATDILACPIGESHVDLRDPAELAISLAAALLQARSQTKTISLKNLRHA